MERKTLVDPSIGRSRSPFSRGSSPRHRGPLRAGALCFLATLLPRTPADAGETGAGGPVVGPYLQSVGPTSVTVMWESPGPSRGVVEYGDGEALDRKAVEETERAIHEVRLSGLEPHTRYRYRALLDGGPSETFEFRTAHPRGATRFRVVAYGDSRTNVEVHARIGELIAEQSPDLILHAGDIVTDGTKKELWSKEFFIPIRGLLGTTCVFPVLGNHERGARFFRDYFSLPGPETYYSFDYGHAHFIALDSNRVQDADQMRWLEEDLAGATAEWIIAFFHHPMMSAQPTRAVNANRWAWQDLFERHGVDVAIAGHDHHYHRSHPVGRALRPGARGVHHFTTGGGGASLYEVQGREYSAASIAAYHVMVLEFNGRELYGRAVDLDRNVFDEFRIDHRDLEEDKPFIAYEMLLWRRDLATALSGIEPIPVGPGRAHLDRTFTLPHPFDGPVGIRWEWVADGAGYRFEEQRGEGVLEAEEAFAVPLRADVSGHGIYPAPVLRLEVTSGNFPRAFANRERIFGPLRVYPVLGIIARRFESAPDIDGALGEPAWSAAEEAGGFVSRSGDRRARGKTSFRAGFDETNLYIGITASTSKGGVPGGGADERDASAVVERDEGTRIHLFPDGEAPALVFAINTRGTLYDARGTDTRWNGDWRGKVSAAPGGWAAELAIPWKVFGRTAPPKDPWCINVSRTDQSRRERSEWIPTFGTPTDPRRVGELRFAQ